MYCTKCGKKLREGVNFCTHCGQKIEQSSINNVAHAEKSNDQQIGGWLILPAIGLIITPLWSLYTFFTEYIPMFSDGTWELLTNSDSAYFISGFSSLIMFEIFFQAVFCLFVLYVAFLFFTRKEKLPRLYILYLVGSLIFVVIDYMWVFSIPELAEALQEEGDYSDLGRSIIAAAIWVPYMLKSDRVKNTFVN